MPEFIPSKKLERTIQAALDPREPTDHFLAELGSRLEAQAKPQRADLVGPSISRQRILAVLHTTWRWSLGLAAIAALAAYLFLSMRLLPRNTTVPAAVTAQPTGTPTAPAPTPTQVPDSSATPTAFPTPSPRLVDGVCNLPVSRAFDGQYLGRANQDNLETLVGGGKVESGDFTFEI